MTEVNCTVFMFDTLRIIYFLKKHNVLVDGSIAIFGQKDT